MHIFLDYGAAISVLNGATFIFQVVGMLLITAASGVLADLLFVQFKYQEPTVGIIVSCVLAAVVAWSFMTIFDSTTDTLLFCYALDHNRHGHAQTAPNEMRKLFE